MTKLTVYYNAAKPVWEVIYEDDSHHPYFQRDPLPHTRRDVSLATLARSVRREYRRAALDERADVARLTRELRAVAPDVSGGPCYEAGALGPVE